MSGPGHHSMDEKPSYRPLRLTPERLEKFSQIYNLKQIMDLHYLEFELFIGYLYRQEGYRVWTTPWTDYGVDLLIERDDCRAVIQCKQFSKNVPLAEVLKLPGALLDTNSDYAVLVTTSGVTSKGREWARRGNKAIRFIEGPALVKWARKVNRSVILNPLPAPRQPFFVPLLRRTVQLIRHNPVMPALAGITTLLVLGLIGLLLSFVTPAPAYSDEKDTPVATLPVAIAHLDLPAITTPAVPTVIVNTIPAITILPSAPLPTPTATPRVKSAESDPCLVGQIKGNKRSKFYHEPGWPYYNSFGPANPIVECFDNAEAARAAGYRPGKQPPPKP
ncbi:MAG TPA: restriction endonuclease [Chloroflexia bacterium]|nr:restriction endonuclease [Chloroflexia bacterium]